LRRIFADWNARFISRLVVRVSLIRHPTAKMMFAKAGCPQVNSVTNRFSTKIQECA
jgi:hypothetical protein